MALLAELRPQANTQFPQDQLGDPFSHYPYRCGQGPCRKRLCLKDLALALAPGLALCRLPASGRTSTAWPGPPGSRTTRPAALSILAVRSR
jgi:hypothetical protein